MANPVKQSFVSELLRRFPNATKLPASQSLYDLGAGNGRIYIRYSKTHLGNRAFYGLRSTDLQQLEGHHSVICFLWNDQIEPLIVPFADFEDVYHSVEPADDGQYKVQVYIANAGRFNVESFYGWNELNMQASDQATGAARSLSHCQVQTLIASIGFIKGNDIWLPANDRIRVDQAFAGELILHNSLPAVGNGISAIMSEIDVIWIKRGSGKIAAMFEVEHSTPVYSGLLRFNDFHVAVPTMRPRFTVVSNDTRRSLFVRQINRPTFLASGLVDLCTFLEYANVYDWWKRLSSARAQSI